MALNPHYDKVYTYVYYKQTMNGFELTIVATHDGINPDIETQPLRFTGDYVSLETYCFLMFKNPIMKATGDNQNA